MEREPPESLQQGMREQWEALLYPEARESVRARALVHQRVVMLDTTNDLGRLGLSPAQDLYPKHLPIADEQALDHTRESLHRQDLDSCFAKR